MSSSARDAERPDALVSVRLAAEETGISPSRLMNMILSGELKAEKINGNHYVSLSKAMELIDQQKTDGREG